MGQCNVRLEDKDRDEGRSGDGHVDHIDIIRSYFLLILGHTHILSVLLMRNHPSGSSAGGGEEGDRIVQHVDGTDKLQGKFAVCTMTKAALWEMYERTEMNERGGEGRGVGEMHWIGCKHI
jgi:hypothetical protein